MSSQMVINVAVALIKDALYAFRDVLPNMNVLKTTCFVKNSLLGKDYYNVH